MIHYNKIFIDGYYLYTLFKEKRGDNYINIPKDHRLVGKKVVKRIGVYRLNHVQNNIYMFRIHHNGGYLPQLLYVLEFFKRYETGTCEGMCEGNCYTRLNDNERNLIVDKINIWNTWPIIKRNIMEICFAFSRNLSAFELYEIICHTNPNADLLPMHKIWDIIVLIKNY